MEPAALRDALLTHAIAIAAERGVEGMSLRTVAAAVGYSTIVIFQNFGSKAGFVDAALARALEEERHFHGALAARLDGLQPGHEDFSNLLASYVELRVRNKTARFWSQILYNARLIDGCAPMLKAWHALRIEFWEKLLRQAGRPTELGRLLTAYLVMEEVYAYALAEEAEYRLLLRASTKTLTCATFGIATSEEDNIMNWLNTRQTQFRTEPPAEPNALSERLLTVAIAEIRQSGVKALNQRRVGSGAGVSGSMIVYHFGDMASFVNQAIWQALMRGIPAELDLNDGTSDSRLTMAGWSRLLRGMVQPGREGCAPGFYTSRARIIGQTCLQMSEREELRPLVEHLRNFEGAGSFRASRKIWPKNISAGRTQAAVFSLWIKGEAILKEALETDLDCDDAIFLSAARLILSLAELSS